MELLFADFLNSDWRDWRGSGRREDRLDKPEWLAWFLQRWALEAAVPLDADTRAQLGVLRDRMRAITEALIDGRPFGDADIAALNRAMEPLISHPRLVPGDTGFRFEQAFSVHGWPLAIGLIARSLAELLADGDRSHRLKICANDDCRWIFVDESRNRTKRWCDDKCCGNLMKVRAFRARNGKRQAPN